MRPMGKRIVKGHSGGAIAALHADEPDYAATTFVSTSNSRILPFIMFCEYCQVWWVWWARLGRRESRGLEAVGGAMSSGEDSLSGVGYRDAWRGGVYMCLPS